MRKNPHGKILRGKLKEQRQSAVLKSCPISYYQKSFDSPNSQHMKWVQELYCQHPNLIPEFASMTRMIIPNLILT